MDIILDTNFTIELVKRKVSFEDIEKYGEIVIPKQVVRELRVLAETSNPKTRDNIALALKLVESRNFKTINLANNLVDIGLIKYVSGKEAVATLDKELRHKLSGKARIVTFLEERR